MSSKWLSHSSFVGHLGGYGDRLLNPLSWMTGGKWTHFTSDVLPQKVNSGLSAVMQPFDWIDTKVNPVRRIPIVDRAANITKAKPGDAAAIAAGAIFGGGALLGGGAGGAAGGTGVAGIGEGGVGSVGTASGFGGVGVDGGVAGLGSEGLGGIGAGGVGAGTADVGGLAAADSAAVDAEGAAPGLTEGYGPASSAPAASSNYSMPQQQQEKRKEQLDQLAVMHMPTLEERKAALTVDSSRALKTAPGLVSMSDVARQGASGADRISENGVHIGAIRALHTKIGRLEAIAKQRGIKV